MLVKNLILPCLKWGTQAFPILCWCLVFIFFSLSLQLSSGMNRPWGFPRVVLHKYRAKLHSFYHTYSCLPYIVLDELIRWIRWIQLESNPIQSDWRLLKSSSVYSQMVVLCNAYDSWSVGCEIKSHRSLFDLNQLSLLACLESGYLFNWRWNF